MPSRIGVLVAFALIIVAYVAGYFAMLRPADIVVLDGEVGLRVRVPVYEVSGSAPRTLFRPALWVDRQVRSRYWACEKLSYGSECMCGREMPAE